MLRMIEEYSLDGIIYAANDLHKFVHELAEKIIPVIWGGTTKIPERWEPVDLNYHTAAALAESGVLFAFSESGGRPGSRNVRRQPVPASLSVAYGLDEDPGHRRPGRLSGSGEDRQRHHHHEEPASTERPSPHRH